MPSLQEVLASIPGLAGYQAQVNQNNATGMNTLQMARGAGGILAQIQAQQAKQQAAQRETQFRTEIGAATTPEAQLAVAMKYGSPDAVARTAAGHMDRGASLQAATLNRDAQREQRKAEIEARGAQKLEEIEARAAEGRISRAEADARALQARKEVAMLVGSMRPERQLPAPIQTDQGLFDRGPNGLVPLMNPGNPSEQLRPASTANLDLKDRQINIRQISGKVADDTKGERGILAAVNRYDNFRGTGDNAQAMTMAAETLRRAAMTGNQRFKGEAEKLLGGGYGGGSLPERMANFLSTEATGTPTAKTIAKLDALMDASETSAVENMADRTRYYAGMARGKKLPLQEAIGVPFVVRNRVVFPDGTHATFPDKAAAMNASKLWKDQGE